LIKIQVLSFFGLFLMTAIFVTAQGQGSYRGSVPEVLLRPSKGESPRYPIDLVIGELGQGRASAGAYSYANLIAAGLLSGQMSNSALSSINPSLREIYLDTLGIISPRSYRIGGGKEEPDGAVSFLVRFIGREFGITGELYIRYTTREIDGETTGSWSVDEFLFNEAKHRDIEFQEAVQMRHRLDLQPYDRFF
jgi:hypothetical protein